MSVGPGVELHLGDCLDILPTIPSGTIDAVVTDPPYPEIDREYGRMTEAAWHEMMRAVVAECRRVLKPSGSAVFVLQPNSERVGRMRPWLFEFQAWACREWNMVQDVWWWNHVAMPTVHTHRIRGLLRPSVKACIWLGDPDCFRNQDAVLWDESMETKRRGASERIRGLSNEYRYAPSGHTVLNARMYRAAEIRGGVTPYNIIIANHGRSQSSAGSLGHGAGTPIDVCLWWTRYICPPGGTVLDPFMGSGTAGLAALKLGRSFVGIERFPKYFAVADGRLRAHAQQGMLL